MVDIITWMCLKTDTGSPRLVRFQLVRSPVWYELEIVLHISVFETHIDTHIDYMNRFKCGLRQLVFDINKFIRFYYFHY